MTVLGLLFLKRDKKDNLCVAKMAFVKEIEVKQKDLKIIKLRQGEAIKVCQKKAKSKKVKLKVKKVNLAQLVDPDQLGTSLILKAK